MPEERGREGPSRFRGQVWPGDTLTTRITVEAIRDQEDPPLVDVAISTVNQNGEEVLAGSATAKLEA